MNEPLSIMHLIGSAGPLVKLVMLLLFLASIVSWVMIVQRGIYQMRAKGAYRAFEKHFWSGVDLTQLYRQSNARASAQGVPASVAGPNCDDPVLSAQR